MIHAYGFPLRLVAEVDGELLDVTDALEYAVTTSTIHVNNQNLLDSIAHYQRISKPPILYQEKPADSLVNTRDLARNISTPYKQY